MRSQIVHDILEMLRKAHGDLSRSGIETAKRSYTIYISEALWREMMMQLDRDDSNCAELLINNGKALFGIPIFRVYDDAHGIKVHIEVSAL